MPRPFVVLLAVLCLGCTSGGDSGGSTPGTSEPPTVSADASPAAPVTVVESGAVDGPLMRHPVRSGVEGGDGAEIRGVLELDDGCLYLSIDEIDERYPVLWPAGTVWDAERDVVVLPSGDEIAVGGSASGAGGYSSVDSIERLAGADAADLAARCVDNAFGEIAVVNNDDAAIGPG